MGISVTEPVGQAIDQAKRICFPFDLRTWTTLGLVAFLATLGEQVAPFQLPNLPSGSSPGTGGTSYFDTVKQWIVDNLTMAIWIGAIALVVGTALLAVYFWVNSRAKLMFVDAIARNRVEVTEPWHRFAELGWSLFRFRIAVALASLAVAAGATAAGIAVVWHNKQVSHFDSSGFLGVLVVVWIGVPMVAVVAVIEVLMNDFVVPAMVERRQRVKAAWLTVWDEILSQGFGTVALYLLVKIALAAGTALLMTIAFCATCCVAALPYVGSVILLPVLVFQRCYSLCFLQQFGWKTLPSVEPDTRPVPW